MSQCGGCGGQKRWLLHNVRRNRWLCTNCILNTHRGLFCPVCFHVYDECAPANDRLTCLKCPSTSHLTCVDSPSFVCPACSSPNFSFDDAVSLNKQSARALVAAAKISALSAAKAAVVARLEAERRVSEAVLAKKRAREALETLNSLSAKEKEKFKSSAPRRLHKLKS